MRELPPVGQVIGYVIAVQIQLCPGTQSTVYLNERAKCGTCELQRRGAAAPGKPVGFVFLVNDDDASATVDFIRAQKT